MIIPLTRLDGGGHLVADWRNNAYHNWAINVQHWPRCFLFSVSIGPFWFGELLGLRFHMVKYCSISVHSLSGWIRFYFPSFGQARVAERYQRVVKPKPAKAAPNMPIHTWCMICICIISSPESMTMQHFILRMIDNSIVQGVQIIINPYSSFLYYSISRKIRSVSS